MSSTNIFLTVLFIYLLLGLIHIAFDYSLRNTKFSLKLHLLRIIISLLLWPLLIFGAYIRYKKIHNVLKPHVKWKHMLFGIIDMKDKTMNSNNNGETVYLDEDIKKQKTGDNPFEEDDDEFLF